MYATRGLNDKPDAIARTDKLANDGGNEYGTKIYCLGFKAFFGNGWSYSKIILRLISLTAMPSSRPSFFLPLTIALLPPNLLMF